MISFTRNAPIFAISILFSVLHFTSAATFQVINQCNYTVWAAAIPGGGRRLDAGQTWLLTAATGPGRFWGRTNCIFNSNGIGQCETGDCNGQLACQSNSNKLPTTLAEYSTNQFNNLDFFDISLVDGFNIPMAIIPSGTAACRGVRCAAATIIEECPNELRARGATNPCTVFKTNEYCCTTGTGNCGPTAYSRFFKDRCPNAFSYPLDNQSNTFTCPSGTNYRVTFCPPENERRCPFSTSVCDALWLICLFYNVS